MVGVLPPRPQQGKGTGWFMSEENGNGTQAASRYTNLVLYEAMLALVALGKEEKLPAGGIGYGLALARRHLRPIAETIEEYQDKLKEEHGIAQTVSLRTPEQRVAYDEKVKTYEKASRAFMKQEVEWSAPCKIRWQQFGDRELKVEHLVALVAAGIVLCTPEEVQARLDQDATGQQPDRKK